MALKTELTPPIREASDMVTQDRIAPDSEASDGDPSYIADSFDYAPMPTIPTSMSSVMPVASQAAVAAAQTGDVKALQAYLDAGGSANALDAAGIMPLHSWAAVRGQAEAFALLGDNGADLRQRSPHSFAMSVHMAAQSDNIDGSIAVLKYILAKDPSMLEAKWVGLSWHTPVLEAAFQKQPKKVEFLAGLGADLSACGIRNANPRFWIDDSPAGQGLKVVLDRFNAPAQNGPESIAYLKKLTPTIPKPILRGAEAVRQSGLALQVQDAMTAIITATTPDAQAAGFGTLRDLVEKQGANLNTLGGLVQRPAVIFLCNIDGTAPDVESRRIEVLNYLTAHGADPTTLEGFVQHATGLQLANVRGELEFAKALVKAAPADKRSAFVNFQGIGNGFTALHDAILRATPSKPDTLALLRFLRQNGALSNHENYAGTTEAVLADRTKSPEVLKAFNDSVPG